MYPKESGLFKDFIKFGVNFVKPYPYDAWCQGPGRQQAVQLTKMDQSNLLDISNNRTPVVNISQVDNVKKQQEEDSFTIKRTPAGQ